MLFFPEAEKIECHVIQLKDWTEEKEHIRPARPAMGKGWGSSGVAEPAGAGCLDPNTLC